MLNSVFIEESDLYMAHSPLCRNPFHCIIPPNVLERLARTGEERRRTMALDTLMVSETFRTARLEGPIGNREGERRDQRICSDGNGGRGCLLKEGAD